MIHTYSICKHEDFKMDEGLSFSDLSSDACVFLSVQAACNIAVVLAREVVTKSSHWGF